MNKFIIALFAILSIQFLGAARDPMRLTHGPMLG
jgi:hypothetical protein